MDLAVRLLAGGLVSAGVATVAQKRAALTRSGAWAAIGVGIALALAGWNWLALVGVFFVTSSILTRIEAPNPATRRSADRTGRRWQQVAANGGVATIAALVYAATGWHQAFAAAAGAIAAATADTWATEVGRWSPSPPRLITTGRRVPPGQSGGVTPLGTAASLAGALLIAGTASVLAPGRLAHGAAWPAWITAAGFAASIIDSVLGATIEGRWAWFDNDAVNVMTTACGAAIMAAGAPAC